MVVGVNAWPWRFGGVFMEKGQNPPFCGGCGEAHGTKQPKKRRSYLISRLWHD